MACTCSGPTDVCGYCAAFESWNEHLSDAERGAYALAFLESLSTATGVLRGEPVARNPWIGRLATVDFNGVRAFDEYLAAQFARSWRAAA